MRRLGAVVAVAVLGAGGSACEGGGARPTATVQAADTADQVLEGFSHYVTAEGVRKSRIEADTAYFYEASQLALLRRLRATFYDAKGAESSHLTARTGWGSGASRPGGGAPIAC